MSQQILAEIERLMAAARKSSRYGHRDATMILIGYRHGLRASELCDLQWSQVELGYRPATRPQGEEPLTDWRIEPQKPDFLSSGVWSKVGGTKSSPSSK
jgi:integrase